MNNPYQPPESTPINVSNEASSINHIISYWESRRVIYNITLFFIGMVTMLLTGLHQKIPLLGILFLASIYGVLANICYSLGPYANILGVIKFKMKPQAWKPLFYLGLFGSSLITFLLATVSGF